MAQVDVASSTALGISLTIAGAVMFVGVAGFFGFRLYKKRQAVVYESMNN
jgi:hypothetical protein